MCAVGPKTGWLDWLNNENHRSFRFENGLGMTCTLVKERRRGSSGKFFEYWYAHKRINDRLRRVYIGKAERLSLARLEQATQQLSQLTLDQLKEVTNGGMDQPGEI